MAGNPPPSPKPQTVRALAKLTGTTEALTADEVDLVKEYRALSRPGGVLDAFTKDARKSR